MVLIVKLLHDLMFTYPRKTYPQQVWDCSRVVNVKNVYQTMALCY